ncbi:hypothetical protein bwei_1515 [Bacillus mycoides]|nr:hypothetical protein bwei_1515 [Bacillus mycoides]
MYYIQSEAENCIIFKNTPYQGLFGMRILKTNKQNIKHVGNKNGSS